jgi:hypothetical protein
MYQDLDCKAPICQWSERSYSALKSLIENSVPEGALRDDALERIETLEKPPFIIQDESATAWADLASPSVSVDHQSQGLIRQLKEIGCAADGSPYVIGGLIPQLGPRFQSIAREAEVATAFLDEAKCPGARDLSKENKEKLEEIQNRATAAASPGVSPH